MCNWPTHLAIWCGSSHGQLSAFEAQILALREENESPRQDLQVQQSARRYLRGRVTPAEISRKTSSTNVPLQGETKRKLGKRVRSPIFNCEDASRFPLSEEEPNRDRRPSRSLSSLSRFAAANPHVTGFLVSIPFEEWNVALPPSRRGSRRIPPTQSGLPAGTLLPKRAK